MNKLWILVPLALATTPALAQPCVLTGTIKNIGAKPIIFRYVQQGQLRRDTVRAVNDRFTYTAKPSDNGEIALIISNPYQQFWYEPGKLTVTGDAARPNQLTIVGTPENNLADRFKREVEWKFDQARKAQPTAAAQLTQQEQQATRLFIKNHPASRTAADALYWQMIYNDKPLAEYAQLVQQLTPSVKQSAQGQKAIKRLLTLQNQPTVGRVVPSFSMADTAGVKHSLATYQGKYVLLDFWGHWCSPCINSMPKLNAMHAQYAQRLSIIGIAMEDEEDAPAWKWSIRKYAVPGLQLSELQAGDGPVISDYNVTAFPTYMLLDPKGALVMRTNNVDDITKKLSTLGTL